MIKKLYTFLKNHKFLLAFFSFIYSFLGLKIIINGKNNKVHKKFSYIRRTKVTIIGSNNSIEFGNSSRYKNINIYIYGNNNELIIKDGVFCMNTEFYFEDSGNIIKVGSKTLIHGAHIAITEPNHTISIGEHCLLSKNIEIRNGDSHSIYDLTSGKRINFASDVFISDHVWIGANATLLKGSYISNNSVVANSALVTSKFLEPNSIIGGFPAKVIKKGVTWKSIRTYDE
jgi:acetyltransferase-like isoleucine patch superfamily enzyme